MLDWIKGFEAVLSILAMVSAAAALAVAWLTRHSKDNAVKIANLEEREMHLSSRMAEMETRMDNLPTKDDFHALKLQLRTVEGSIETVSTRLESVDRTARRIDDFLLNRGERS